MVAVTDEELRQLRESAEKYRMMIDQASDAILAISPENGEILEANPKTEEMTGYALPELLGMKVWVQGWGCRLSSNRPGPSGHDPGRR